MGNCKNKLTVHTNHVIQTIIVQKDGWLQYFELIPHENGFVIQLTDYFGGEGEKPTEYIGWYMGADGWVESISDAYVIAEKGEQVQIRNNGEFIQWKYESDVDWIDLILIADLKGEKGDKGDKGDKPVMTVGVNGNWFVDGVDTGQKAQGDAFEFDDFTEEEIALLQQPAIDAAETANQAAENANDAAVLALAQRAYVNYLFGITQNETDAVMEYARMNGYKKPGSLYITKLDSHIRDLKTAGLWNKMDLAYWMVGDGDMNFKTINIIDPSKFKGILHGGLVNALQGIEGNGVDGYVDTDFNPSIGVNKYTLNDAGRHAYIFKDPTNNTNLSTIDGAISNNNCILNMVQIAQRINQGSASLITPMPFNGSGFTSLNRVSSSEVIGYKNDIETIGLANSTAIENSNQSVLRRGIAVYGNAGISTYSMGASLTGQESIEYRQAILNNL